MKKIVCLLTICLIGLALNAQRLDSSPFKLTCDPFNPEDSTGQLVWNLLNNYEIYSHFGREGEMRGNKTYASQLKSLFDEHAMVTNDLGTYEQLTQKVTISEYVETGLAKGYQKFLLVAEKKIFEANRSSETEDYIGYVQVFKIFSDTARLKKEYDLGMLYELEIRFWGDSLQAAISNITVVENKVYEKYMLSGYGYHGNSQLLISNNLGRLLTFKEPPKPKEPKQSKSGFYLHAGYLFTDYLNPEAIKGNLNPNTRFSGSEFGYVGGLQYQIGFGDKDLFGILFGVEYELNYYQIDHSDILFEYTLDCDGKPLRDLEGSPYDKKLVEVSSYSENGDITYIRPEVGLFLNLGLAEGFNLQLFGLVGNSFIANKSYKANALVSYTGYLGDFTLSERPELGFYKDLEVEFDNNLQTLQSFMFYRIGATADINLAKWLAFSIMAEYRGSMTYALRFRQFNCAFLDPADSRTFVSQFDYANASRFYNAFGLQAGFKIFIKEKKKQ